MSTYWKVAYDSGELGSAQTSVTISSLDGNTDGEYQLITRIINGYNGAVNYGVRLNNDTGSNYGRQTEYANNTTAAAARTTESYNRIGYVSAQNQVNTYIYNIFPKSGYTRTAIGKGSFEVSGTTVGYAALDGLSWSNTADNITSIVVLADQTNGIGVGSRIILLKKTNTFDATKTWEEIYNNTLSSAATSVTVSGLAGNTDVLYRIRNRYVSNYAGDNNFKMRINGDTTANIVGTQALYGTNTTVTATRYTSNTLAEISATSTATGRICMVETLLYAKTGYVRTALSEIIRDITGTTVSFIILQGDSYNETSTEMTSLVISSDQTNGLGVGTSIIVERLNL